MLFENVKVIVKLTISIEKRGENSSNCLTIISQDIALCKSVKKIACISAGMI